MDDRYYMQKTISLAKKMSENDLNRDIPVAAILVDENGEIIAESINTREEDQSILAHAEINALELGAKIKKTWNLSSCSLYVSLEPCAMCAGAILQSHIKRVVFAAYEPKTGALGSRYNLITKDLEIRGGFMEEEASELIKDFFQKLRA